MAEYTPDPALVALVAEALGARRNGPASDGRGWFRTEADRVDCYSDAAAALSALAAEGRLPAEIEWALRFNDGAVSTGLWTTEKSARQRAQEYGHEWAEPVCRWVGPWLPVPTNTEETP